MKDLTDRALQGAAVMVLFGLALRWTWSVVEPLAPVVVVVIVSWAVLRCLDRRTR